MGTCGTSRADGTLLRELATQVHGGIGGFMGVTMSALSPDESTLVYCSETGPRLMRYDLENVRQLPDLQCLPEGEREMFFAMDYGPQGRLYVSRGHRIDLVSRRRGARCAATRSKGRAGRRSRPPRMGRHLYVGNFFSGQVVKMELESGELGRERGHGCRALARGDCGVRGRSAKQAKLPAKAKKRANPAKRAMPRKRATRRRRAKARKRVRRGSGLPEEATQAESEKSDSKRAARSSRRPDVSFDGMFRASRLLPISRPSRCGSLFALLLWSTGHGNHEANRWLAGCVAGTCTAVRR